MIAFAVAALTLWSNPVVGPASAQARSPEEDAAPGQLTILDKQGRPTLLCPLEGTKVDAEIDGFGARVTVVQTFTNPSKTPIEAVYTFPLPSDAAVDRMRMQVGTRIIEGEIKRREEARAIYDEAKAAGQVASLLDQERPNIFTQSVANILPGAKVRIEISYVQLLKFEEGQFEFSYPMVVGPRFIPDSTPDPGKVVPAYVPKGMRSGTTIELNVRLQAGAPIRSLGSVLHEVKRTDNGPTACTVSLAKKDEIPNKDFILRYSVATDSIQDALLTHWDPRRGGTFTLVLMPPKNPAPEQVAPKEVIFVMDQSGSQNGFPIEKSRELTLELIDKLNPGDTFNVLGFANQVNFLWRECRPFTPENRRAAEDFVKGLQADGGTQLLHAVNGALGIPEDPERMRIVVFNTDGYVGNDFEILDAIQKHRGFARMFTFGIGNGVNRFLIEAMSAEGKGDAEIVTLAEAADPAVERFIRRTRNPILTDVQVQFDGVVVDDVLPTAIPDVFSEKPVIVKGRYTKPGKGTILLSGKLGKERWSKQIEINLPDQGNAGSAIATLWARAKVDDLMRQNWRAVAERRPDWNPQKEIVSLALDYGLMTQYTSFVAVEKKVVNVGGKQRTVAVPVDMTDGVNLAPEADGLVRTRSLAMPAPGAAGGGGFGGRRGAAQAGAAGPPATLSARIGRSEDKAAEPLRTPNLSPAEKRKNNYESKVDKALRESKAAKVEVQVRLKNIDEKTLAKLKELGLSIEDQDEGLKIVFGTCDPKKLVELAQIEAVLRIDRLDP